MENLGKKLKTRPPKKLETRVPKMVQTHPHPQQQQQVQEMINFSSSTHRNLSGLNTHKLAPKRW